MPGPSAAVAAVRRAVRDPLSDAVSHGRAVLLACSGGADSLALVAAVSHEADVLRRAGRAPQVAACVVDHGLQAGSQQVAEGAAAACRGLGIEQVGVRTVQVRSAGEGLEAAARQARYEALAGCAEAWGTQVGAPVEIWVAHTRDDQAEQVLLGLLRGAGTRSLAGMAPRRGQVVRPLLGVAGATTREACRDLGLEPHHDPHNDEARFTRVRARRALSLVTQELGEDLAPALARSADHARADADLLDDLAEQRLARLTPSGPGQGRAPTVAVASMREVEDALRPRVWRRLVRRAAGEGAPDPTSVHLRELDRLVTDWSGQGPVDVPGSHRWWRWRDEGGDPVVGPIGKNEPPAPGARRPGD